MEAEIKNLNQTALKGQTSSSFLKSLKPYLFISLTGILAFTPVSFMLRALKNDIIAIEYPIKYFISECIHNGEIPLWFNTWAMGFPLQSNLTWGIFSTPQLFFSSLFNYNIYVLHIEFMFYILLAGWAMFYFLKKNFNLDERIAQILACCYMLSGFVTGSSQWLLYITAASFAPLVLISFLQLLKKPSFRHSLLFAVFFYLMFTNVYQAFNIISSYCLAGFFIYYFIRSWKDKKYLSGILKYTGFSFLLVLIFCAPVLFYTFELLNYMGRGDPISNASFFNSNYLHPSGLLSMLMPLSVAKTSLANTEGTMMNSYMGLFILLILPLAFLYSIKEKKREVLILFAAAIVFLLISFGNILPFRNWMNVLPGLSYFRHPGIFRFYFILFFILAAAIFLSGKKMEDLFSRKNKMLMGGIILFLSVFMISFIISLINSGSLNFISIENSIKNISFIQTILLNSAIQILLLSVLLFLIFYKKYFLFTMIFAFDLVINTLICTPFFTASSYSLPHVNSILSTVHGFPLQQSSPSDVKAVFTDDKNNNWNNVNVFKKEVSGLRSYLGPLVLKNFSHRMENGKTKFADKKLEFHDDAETNIADMILQKPSRLQFNTKFTDDEIVQIQQNYFPGWKATFNKSPVPINQSEAGLSVAVPKGEGLLNIQFEKKGVWISALIMHLLVIISVLSIAYLKLRKYIS